MKIFFFLLVDYVANLSWYLLVVFFFFFFFKLLVDHLMCSMLMRNWVYAIHFFAKNEKRTIAIICAIHFLGSTSVCVKVGLEIAGYALL